MAEEQMDPLGFFLTIRWDGNVEHPHLEVDVGSMNHYEAVGVLASALQDLKSRGPWTTFRQDGEALPDFEDEDGEE